MSPSLFEAPQTSAVVAAANWLAGTLFGPVGLALCVVAVAMVGFMMLNGRLTVFHALRVLVGCFVLLGAPTIAISFLGFGEDAGVRPPEIDFTPTVPSPPRNPPPANYDPYAGASLRDAR